MQQSARRISSGAAPAASKRFPIKSARAGRDFRLNLMILAERNDPDQRVSGPDQPGLVAGVGDRPAFSPGSTSTCFVRVGGMGRVSGRRPGRLRTEPPSKLRKRSASGHAAAKARRMRLVVSTTCSGDFQETKTQRRELGSGQFPGLGMASRTASINQ